MARSRYLYLCSGAIGEALLGIHIGRTLAANVPGAVLEITLPRPNPFVRELVAELPFVAYRELSKKSLASWLGLLALLPYAYKSVVLEPVTVAPPVWWRLLLWCARFRGGVEVRYQMQGHERPLPRGGRRLSYVCQTQNYFDTPPSVLRLWDLPAEAKPRPTLPPFARSTAAPYILFHFFAGNYKRTIPLDHARAILREARVKFPRHRFVLTCMASERERALLMIEGIENAELDSGLSAQAVLGLLSGADLVVGTASGILLAAAHLEVPVVAMSCLSDPCWLPTFSPHVTIVANREECRCNGDKTGECSQPTPEGDVFRCLYFIPTKEVIDVMEVALAD